MKDEKTEREELRRAITKSTGKYRPCKNCGLTFYVPTFEPWPWVCAADKYHKQRKVWFCSYHCMREYQQKMRKKGMME